MGNWGNTMEAWYHRSALIIWRKADELYFEFRRNPANAIKKLSTGMDSILAQQPNLFDTLTPEIVRYSQQSPSQIPDGVVCSDFGAWLMILATEKSFRDKFETQFKSPQPPS